MFCRVPGTYVHEGVSPSLILSIRPVVTAVVSLFYDMISIENTKLFIPMQSFRKPPQQYKLHSDMQYHGRKSLD